MTFLYTPQLPTLPRGAAPTGPIDPPVIQRLTDGSYVAHPYSYFGIQLSAGLQQLVPAYDDAVTIEAARQQAGPGGLVRLLPAVYQTFTPVGVVFGADVAGLSAQDDYTFGATHITPAGGTILQPQASFAGAGVIQLAAVNHAKTQGPGFADLQIDGGLLPAGTVNLIDATGPVINVRWQRVYAVNGPNWGCQTHADPLASGNQHPYQWYVYGSLVFHQCAGGGMTAVLLTDCEIDTLVARGCGANGNHGFVIQDWDNSKIKSLRSEFAGTNHGVRFTGAWQTGAGAGSLQIGMLSTDRNNGNGVLVDATGTSHLIIGSMMLRRDGLNGGTGGGGFAGLAVNNATIPVIIGQIATYVGVNDDGTGPNTPQIGVALSGTNTLVVISGGVLEAATTSLSGSSGLSNRNLWGATGTTSSMGALAAIADSA